MRASKYLIKAISSRAMQWLACFFTVCLVIAYIALQGLKLSIDIPTFHLDGAFQTASGLFRLQAGQVPGRDFLPYLGIAPLLLIFPFFTVAGGNLAASVFASYFVTRMTGWIAFSMLWHFMFRPRLAIASLVGGAAIFLGESYVAAKLKFPDLFSFWLEPGNSLRPVRATLPYLLAMSIWFLITACKSAHKRNVVAGLITGVALLWSNDFAIPAGGLFILFLIVFFILRRMNHGGLAQPL